MRKRSERPREIISAYKSGMSAKLCADEFGVSVQAVLSAIKRIDPSCYRGREAPKTHRSFDLTLEVTGSTLELMLSYDPAHGTFRHQTGRGPRSGGVGSIAGTRTNNGYVSIVVCGQRFLAHRLAWLWMTGDWPKGEIDHINGNRSDNRFCNLREATRSQQGANGGKRITNSSGVVGVHFDRSRAKFASRIGVNNKTINLGRFATLREAAAARETAEKKFFGRFRPLKRDGWRSTCL